MDGGELPGAPSTVVDLTRLEADGEYELLREGALSAAALSGLLAGEASGTADTFRSAAADEEEQPQ